MLVFAHALNHASLTGHKSVRQTPMNIRGINRRKVSSLGAYSLNCRFDLGCIEHYRVLRAVDFFNQRLRSSWQSRKRLEPQTGWQDCIDSVEELSLLELIG